MTTFARSAHGLERVRVTATASLPGSSASLCSMQLPRHAPAELCRAFSSAQRVGNGFDSLSRGSCSTARRFSIQTPAQATYRRFGQPPNGYGGQGGNNPLQQAIQQFGGGKGGGQSGKPRGFDAQGKTILIVVAGGAVFYYLIHLERVPETGRLRFIDVSVAQEKELGQQTFQQVMSQFKGAILPASDPRVRMVRRVAARIVEAAKSNHSDGSINVQHLPWAREGNEGGGGFDAPAKQQDDTNWQVFVVNSDQKNAFVLPNGKIFVFSGILPVCKDEDGLATVLGHEVAHQVCRHMAEKVSGTKVIYALGILISSLIGDAGNLGMVVSNFLYSLPNSRKVEIEADRIGLRLMSAACFDPTKAPSLWERMEKAEGRQHNAVSDAFESVLSTHPLSSKRMVKLQEWLPEARQIREDTGCPSPGALQGFRSAAGDGGVAAFPSMRQRYG